MKARVDFDEFADDYDAALARGLAVSGESRDYFARRRTEWTARAVAAAGGLDPSGTILDYGCGTGSTTPFLLGQLAAKRVLGVDISARSIEVARAAHGSDRVRFEVISDKAPQEPADLAYCNGVFHHIPPERRDSAVAWIHASLRPGGMFALWENNPWNPGTRFVMWRCPFDGDAVTLPPPQAAALLARGGFEILGVTFQFIFPRFLGALRPAEPLLSRLPLGAQYLVLARKPDGK